MRNVLTGVDIAKYIIESTVSMYEDGSYYVHWSEKKGLNYDGNMDSENITVTSECRYADGLDEYEFYQKESYDDEDFMRICEDLANKLNREIM